MNNSANDNPAAPRKRRGYNDKEYESALNFVTFLYDLWRHRNENAIMEVDKTFYDNRDEPTVN